jgi:hypothetical protein
VFEIKNLLRRTVKNSADPFIGAGQGAPMNEIVFG